MNLKIRQKIWCLLFKNKFLRYSLFYKLNRYKGKLKYLDKLKLNKNSVVLDIGANNGVVSQYLFDQYSCKIYLFEPNKYCFLILKNIFKKNKKVKVHNFAVSKSDNLKKLYFNKQINDFRDMAHSEGCSLEVKKSNLSKEKFMYTKCISIKNLIKKFSFIDFIKIDIEGHEYKIIPEILKNFNKIKKVYCEMHGRSHRKEFKKQFLYYDKKLKKFKDKNFFYW